jgi:hypothetical protein
MIPSYNRKRSIKGFFFCRSCREQHSPSVLAVQAEHGKSIHEVLLDASSFQSAVGMADYIGVSFVTIYNWISSYFKISFQEFRRQYVCKKNVRDACYSLDISRSAYSRHDYVLKKIRMRRYCACVDVMTQNQIRTNAPLDIVQGILKGNPNIEQMAAGEFALRPLPVYFQRLHPVYLDGKLRRVISKKPDRMIIKKTARIAAESTVSPSAVIASSELTFRDRVFLVLFELGGSADIPSLRFELSVKYGKVYRANNTRREVYRKPDMAFFSGDSYQIMNLSPKGMGYVLHTLLPRLSSGKNS